MSAQPSVGGQGAKQKQDSIPRTCLSPRWRQRLKRLLTPLLLPMALLVRRWRVAQYLASEPRPKLQIGCGHHRLPGWLNADLYMLSRQGIIYMDARRKLPFADNALDFILNEQMIGSLTLEETESFFRECHRILKPGGVLRTATADWDFLVRLSTSQEPVYEEYVHFVTDRFLRTGTYSRCLVTNWFLSTIGSLGKGSIYDAETLRAMLSRAGFSEIVREKVGHSRHPELTGVEGHTQIIPWEFDKLEAFVLEATKRPETDLAASSNSAPNDT